MNDAIPGSSRRLSRRLLIGAAAGIIAGALAHWLWADSAGLAAVIRYVSQPVGQIFIRLLFMLVVPLVFSGLVVGVAGFGEVRHLGRVGFKTLGYTLLFSSVAVVFGLLLVNWLQPGGGVPEATRAALLSGAAERAGTVSGGSAPQTGWALLLAIIPDNPVKAAANGDILAVMFFALFLGVGLALTRTDAARRFEGMMEGLYDVSMRLISVVIALAPVGVAALLFTLTAQLGYKVLLQLGQYTLLVIAALAIHQFVVFGLALKFIGGRSPLEFYRGIQSAMLTAFSTASSAATLPTALKVADEQLRLPHQVSRFVLTLGSTANQNGTALFEGVTVLFLAQFYGVDLSLADQAIVMGICILGGIGTAGVPSGSLPVVAIILGMVGVPVEGVGLILGVNQLLDMCRTTVNVSGDLAIATLVARNEPEQVPGDPPPR